MLSSLVRQVSSALSHPSIALTTARSIGSDSSSLLRLRRALLYLPALDPRKVAKASTLDVDCVCLDLEDAVAMNKKEEARMAAVQSLETIDFGRSERLVRINAISSPHAVDDIKTILKSNTLPDGLVIPKVTTTTQLDQLFELIYDCLRHLEEPPNLALITQVEDALGLLNLREICEMDEEDSIRQSQYCTHEALIFGGDDFAADIGATRSEANDELLYARQSIVCHAKAFDLQAIDIVNINYKDTKCVEAEAIEGSRFGFTGKQIIHPNQVAPVQNAFSPSPEKVDWALSVVAAHYENEDKGQGAFSFNNQMIDMPTIKQCQNFISQAVAAGIIDPDQVPQPLNQDEGSETSDAQ